MTTLDGSVRSIVPGVEDALARLLKLRRALLSEIENAPSPAVACTLEIADVYLFLGLSYLGYAEELYPEER